MVERQIQNPKTTNRHRRATEFLQYLKDLRTSINPWVKREERLRAASNLYGSAENKPIDIQVWEDQHS